MEVSEFCRRRALDRYPQLARAVPPKSLGTVREAPLREGSPPYAVANYFWRDHQEASVRRKPNDPTALVGPIVARGACLNPIRWDGDEMYFDPTLPAQHGDVVLFQFLDSRGQDELAFMSKLLVEFAGEYWLAHKDGMFPLADIRILGVEVDAFASASLASDVATTAEISRARTNRSI